MANNLETQIKITAKDETKVAFNSVGVSMKGLAGAASSLGTVLGGAALAGGAALGVFLVDAAKGAAEAQSAIARVDGILKTMGDSALKNRDALLKNSEAAVRLGFDDEAAAESIAKFYQRTNDLTKATELNNLAMDIARAKNIGLEEASSKVNLAMSGNVKILKEFGISLGENATGLEIVAALQDKVGGRAEAVKNTFAVQMQVLSESVSNLKDTVGAALLEAIQPFVDQLVTFANDPKTVAKVKEIATAIGNFATTALPIAIESIKILYSWFQNVVNVMSEVILFIEKVIQKINDLISAAQRLSSSAFSSIKNVGNSIGSGIGNVVGKINPFDTGGIVPGPIGSAQLAVVHGGETILPTHKTGFSAGSTINIINPVLLDDTMVSILSSKIAELLRQDFRY